MLVRGQQEPMQVPATHFLTEERGKGLFVTGIEAMLCASSVSRWCGHRAGEGSAAATPPPTAGSGCSQSPFYHQLLRRGPWPMAMIISMQAWASPLDT